MEDTQITSSEYVKALGDHGEYHVISGLDYCNSLYYGLPDKLLNKLFTVQKSAARLISNTPKYGHITNVLVDLHWLPIRQRTEYKILLLVYKALHGLAPKYLEELLVRRSDWGSRRDNDDRLMVPKVKRVTFGGISFSRAGPDLWNDLPSYIRQSESVEQFKTLLKTYLFKKAYGLD